MAWTTPRTWVTGEVVTATLLNTHLRDNVDDLHRRTTSSSATVATSQTTASTTYADLATVGPAVTVTIGSSGLADVNLYAALSNNTAGAQAIMGVAVSGATTGGAADDFAIAATSAIAGNSFNLGATFPLTGLNAGSNTFTAKYKVGSGTGSFAFRRITVTPLGS